MVLGPVSCPAKYMVLPFLSHEMAKLQCWGATHPRIPISFVSVLNLHAPGHILLALHEGSIVLTYMIPLRFCPGGMCMLGS